MRHTPRLALSVLCALAGLSLLSMMAAHVFPGLFPTNVEQHLKDLTSALVASTVVTAALLISTKFRNIAGLFIAAVFGIVVFALFVVALYQGAKWYAGDDTVQPLFQKIKDVATVVGVLSGAASLVFTALNTWLTARTNRAKFWLDLRAAFSRHDEIHHKLHPRSEWGRQPEPPTPEEQFQLEAYMGLFEHCEIMLDQRLIDESTFREIYEYRLRNLVMKDWVRVEKLCNIPKGWRRLIALLRRMGISLECAPDVKNA